MAGIKVHEHGFDPGSMPIAAEEARKRWPAAGQTTPDVSKVRGRAEKVMS